MQQQPQQPQQPSITPITQTHNLFLHKLLDNEPALSVHMMRLQTHSTLYHNGQQSKYLTNLVIVGRNYIQIYAVFQHQVTIHMGIWYLYEDVQQVHQWDKCIVIKVKGNKIVGFVYQDCMIKNCFMFTLEFLELGYRENVQIVCDKAGMYMLVATAREILLCLSPKCIQKQKARPFPHQKMTIIDQPVKWNRPDAVYGITQIIKFQFYDYDLSKVQNFHFSENLIYFMGYSSKNGNVNTTTTATLGTNNANIHNRRCMYQIQIQRLFQDKEKEGVILELGKVQEDIKEGYVIRRENDSQFFVVKKDNSMHIKNQKGQFPLQTSNFLKTMTPQSCAIFLFKPNNSILFPIYIIHKHNNTVLILQRTPSSSISTPQHFHKKIVQLPQNVKVQYCDVYPQQGILAYCNNYEVGIVWLRGHNKQEKGQSMKDENNNSALTKIVLKEYFGRIVDFNIGQHNLIILENTFKSKCEIKLLRKSIQQNPKPFIMVPKKIALQKIAHIKQIRSLQQLLQNQYELTETQKQLKKLKEILAGYLLIQKHGSNENWTLYRLVDGPDYEPIIQNFWYWNIVKCYNEPQNNSLNLKANSWYLILINNINELEYYNIDFSTAKIDIRLHTKSKPIPIPSHHHPLTKIKQYLFSAIPSSLQLLYFNWTTGTHQTIKLSKHQPIIINDITKQNNNNNNLQLRVSQKNITFKKKDKDNFIVEVNGIEKNGNKMYIWEVLVQNNGESRLLQITDSIGEGIPMILPTMSVSASNILPSSQVSHEFRAGTCPEYLLGDKSLPDPFYKPQKIIKIHLYSHQTQNYLFMITSNEQLILYKKIYAGNTQSSSNSINYPLQSSSGFGIGTSSNTFGAVQTGFVYYRVPLQLNVVKKWKYHQNTAFVDLGCNMLRVCNFVFYKCELLQISDNVKSIFLLSQPSQPQIWSISNESKLKPLVTSSKVVSHYMTTKIKSGLQQQLLGIQSTNQAYIVYSRNGFQVFDKQLNSTWLMNFSETNNKQNKQYLIAICAYDHYVAVSLCNYCEQQNTTSSSSGAQYKSVKFKLRVYNTITKRKYLQKQSSYQSPVLHIRYIAPDKLLTVTSSTMSLNSIKSSNQTIMENPKSRLYSKRGMLGCFSYHPEKIGTSPGFMLLGGLYGGLSFYVGQWIDKDRLDQMWVQDIKSGIRELQMFHYGGSMEVFKAVIADDCQNIIVLDLKPKNANKIADFHIGSEITSIKKRNQIPYISSSDGCIRMLIPIKLKDPQLSYLDLQQQISRIVPFLGGFNSRDSRLLNQRKRTYKIVAQGNMIDGEIVKAFFALSGVLKDKIYDATDLKIQAIKSQLLNAV